MLFNLINRLEQADFLIRTKSTGCPADMARRLGISERSLYELLQTFKKLGAPIRYSRSRGTYYYLEEGRLETRFRRTG